jgi:putative ABC transport system substrate-binding protein
MRRREFITLLGGATAAWPIAARAQQGERMRRIGVLMATAETDPESPSRVVAFQQSLATVGWITGQNIRIDYRWAAGEPTRMQVLARELVDLQPDVILASTTPSTAALMSETRTIPIVFVVVSDPVGSGFVASIPRPGGNITGFTNIESSLGGKWIQLLKEIAPRVTRVALMFNPETAPFVAYYLRPIETAAPSFAVEHIVKPIRTDSEIEPAIADVGRDSTGGLIVLPETFTTIHRKSIILAAARNNVPTIYPFRYMAADGGLIAYGIDLVDLYRRAAPYIDRILRGANPADLPVQAPTKFELVINLKTAKALGLQAPSTLLAVADEVIE